MEKQNIHQKQPAFSVLKHKTKKSNNLLNEYIKNSDLMLMFLPGLIALIVFNYIPLYGILIAFKDYKMLDGVIGSQWVGLDNFQRLFSGADFGNVLKNTLVISILKYILGFPAPIMLALLLNEVRAQKFKKTVQTISYLPHFFSWVILGGIVTMLFSTTGPVNEILSYFGVQKPLQFFSNGQLYIILLVVTAIWASVGWGSIVYLAAISGIDESMYEAAYLDGANRLKQTFYITIPTLIPTIVTVGILNLGGILNAGFDQIYNTYNPSVYQVADIIDTYVLRRMQQMDFSLGTAVGLFKSVVGVILIMGTNYIIKIITDGEQGII